MENNGGETHAPPVGLTLGGILSIKQTPPPPPYRIHDRTLLDLIRDDQNSNESKKTWKIIREKIRLKLAGTVCNTAVPTLNSHVHIPSPVPVPVPETVDSVAAAEEVVGEEPVRMSLMSLLEVDGSSCLDGDDDVAVPEVVTVDDGGDGGCSSGGGGYNNCCVCMVRDKGAAFIPCGHTFCRLCSREVFVKRASCPLCNHFILEILDIF